VGVVLSWKRSDIHWDEGVLDTTRRKTRHPIRIELYRDGELTEFGRVLKAAMDHPRKVGSLYVISNDRGQPLSYNAFWQRFRTYRKKAGVTFELRAIRRQTSREGPGQGDAAPPVLNLATNVAETVNGGLDDAG
jgi:integrase